MKTEKQPAGLAYTLREIDPKLWHAVKVKALDERRTMKDVILTLLAAWLKTGAILLVLVLPASAQSLKLPTVLYIAGAALDTGTTLDGFRTGRCYESTRGMQWGTNHPQAFAAFSVGAAVGAIYLWRYIGKESPKLAWIGLIGMGVARGAVGVDNYRRCR